jgi:hypothetical protein
MRALGLDPATAKTLDQGWTTYSVDPLIGGTPTTGMATFVTAGHDGVVRAEGWLGSTVAGAEYPLVSAKSALGALSSQPAPLPAVACAETDRGEIAKRGPDFRRCETSVVVTGARLGLSLQWDDSRPVLVPSWLFTVRGWDAPLVAIAVAPAYLTTPSAQPTDQPEPAGPPSSGGTSSGNVGSGQPGATGTASPVPPSDPVDPPQSRFSVRQGAAPDQLVVTFFGGVDSCFSYRVQATETAKQVRLGLVETRTGDGACMDLAQRYDRVVKLTEPLGARDVVDAETGEIIPLAAVERLQ